MRIAVLEPSIEGIGGAQKVIAKYSSYLKEKGHDVEIFTQKYNPSKSYEEFHKIKVNILKPSKTILSPFVFLFKKFKKFDVVILNDFPTNFSAFLNKNSLWVCYAPRRYLYDLREYYTKTGNFKKRFFFFLKILLFKWIDLLSSKYPKKITVPSKSVSERAQKYYRRKPILIYHGIDCNDFHTGKYEDYVLCVSRFVDQKRVDLIIKSMGFVKNKNMKLFVVGEGPDKDKVKILCQKYKNVKFIGPVFDKKRLAKLYSNCLAYIHVPLQEDLGLSPIEAAASGKPVIGSNEGGLKETVINKKTGFLLDEVTPQKIAEKIDFFAENKNMAKEMGLAGKKNAKNFDWSILLPKLEKLIKSVTYNKT